VVDWHERTEAEREAARREREARRLGRIGEPSVRAADQAAEPDAELYDSEAESYDYAAEEAPSGIRRVMRPPGASAGNRRPARGERRHSRAGRMFAVLALVLGIAALWFVNELFQPFHGSGHGSVIVKIPPHESSGQVGDLLEREGVVPSSFFFELRATLAGKRGSLRPGTYHLKLDMSYGDVLKILTTPPPAAKVTELTITEGKTRRQIDALLRSQGVRGSYLKATRRSSLLNLRRYGAPRRTGTLEGFLFPSTYELTEPLKAGSLVKDQLQTFRQRFARVNLSYARSKKLTPYQVLIVASMVEREAATARDRPLVASVIYNRLARGMLLQIDATVRYATNNYASPITVSQLHSGSPWNTYVHKGLPPTPIDNPGLASIQAAAHPANTNYLFFVVKPCGSGEHVFSSTLAQFTADQQRYTIARTRRGGRSPAQC
jgi:UPF0755 protein